MYIYNFSNCVESQTGESRDQRDHQNLGFSVSFRHRRDAGAESKGREEER